MTNQSITELARAYLDRNSLNRRIMPEEAEHHLTSLLALIDVMQSSIKELQTALKEVSDEIGLLER